MISKAPLALASSDDNQVLLVERSLEFSLTGVSYCAPGRMLLNDSRKGPSHLHYRRPYGCAVLSVLDVLQSLTELKEEKDFVLKVYT